MSKDVKQTNNIVLGDMAGGSIFKNINIPSKDIINNINCLYSELKNEILENSTCKEFLDKFSELRAKLPDDKLDLEQKLIAGKRQDIVNRALRGKEKFFIKIKKKEYYYSAQRIYEILLTKVITIFELTILPQIQNGQEPTVIDNLIYNNIIKEIQSVLGVNYLDIDDDDILNMVYFLTGNCHIKWS
jgi:hypothetical protein